MCGKRGRSESVTGRNKRERVSEREMKVERQTCLVKMQEGGMGDAVQRGGIAFN